MLHGILVHRPQRLLVDRRCGFLVVQVTAGSAFAVSVSYASTYALGRAACSYLYYKKTAAAIDERSIRAVYQDAMEHGRQASKNATKAKKQ